MNPGGHPLSSAMSELDAFSDSDWLDISSGRDSDDNDSLSDGDSDRDEISSASRSRRSSISNDSSVGGDVEAWEGFVSDSGDEAADALTGMYPVPLPSALGTEPIAVGFVPSSAEVTDPALAEEDQRVKEALDQSFVGTLSASRSSTSGIQSSTHTSVRDLRLSFPDPLTSSRDELSRSYEAVASPTESTASSSPTDDETNGNGNDTDLAGPITSSSIPPAYPGISSTTPEVQRHEDVELQVETEERTELDIVLYGSSSEIKWQFVQDLIQKAALFSGKAFVNTLQEGAQVQTLRLLKESTDIPAFFNTINVYDRTNDASVKAEVDTYYTSDRPSLAIVYLPTATLPILTWHSSFLPVLIPFSPDGDDTVIRQAAEDDWDLLAVPPQKTLKIDRGNSPVFDSEELVNVKASDVYHALTSVGDDGKKIGGPQKPLTEQIKSVNAVTIFALMSIVMGFAFNTTFGPTAPTPTPTVNTPSSSNGHLWGMFAPQPNRSVIGSSTHYSQANGGVTGPGVITNSFDHAMAVYDARTTSLSVTSPPSSMSIIVASSSKAISEVTTTSPIAKCKQCGKSAACDKSRPSTELVVRSATATSLSELPQGKTSLSVVTSHTNSDASGSSIALGVPGAIPKSTIATAATTLNLNAVSEAFDATTKAFTEAVSNDLNELAEAADEFLASIREQTDHMVRQSKGKARAIGEVVVARNERAKMRAKEITKKGGEIVRGATEGLKEGFKERSGRARRRAKELKKTVLDGGNEALRSYGKAQEEWEVVLLGKNSKRRRSNGRGHRTQGKEEKENGRAEKESHPQGTTERQTWKGFSRRRRQA